jgi:acetylornithine deacetylase/succinyl-diaminopimelate desuccinylase-like protein
VVPADPADWARDPFTLVEENGYLFGRGTQDMKADIANLVTSFMQLRAEGFVPGRDLVLVFTGDEETEQATARDLVENHRDLVDAEFALNADGWSGILDDETGAARIFYLQGAEKAYATFEISAHNPGGHSSEPRVDNAIYELAQGLTALRQYQFPVMANEWTRASLAASGAASEGELGDALRRFAANPDDAGSAEVLAGEPSFVGRTRTTCVATMLKAGHAENELPQTASATVNCRVFPGTSTASVRDVLQSVVGEGLEVNPAGPPFESVASPMRADVFAAVQQAVHSVYPGVKLVPDQASYYTDSSFFRLAGIPAYGASGLFIRPRDSFYHGLNERVPVASFDRGFTYWYQLMKAVAAPAPASGPVPGAP